MAWRPSLGDAPLSRMLSDTSGRPTAHPSRSGLSWAGHCPMGVLALLALSSLGASCDDGNQERGATDVSAATGGGDRPERITQLDQVDLSDLTRGERRIWADVVNDRLSPCGDPVSVARCVVDARGCRRCVPAVRYVARLVEEGYAKREIDELYDLRYGRDSEVDVDVGDAPVRGSPMAPVTIIEFSDFQCPYCGAAAPLLTRLLREQQGRVRLAFKYFPLDSHPHAMPAARAAAAAANQGKFWEMHDLLFAHQDALEADDLDRYARSLGLDVVRFDRDMQSDSVQRRIEADRSAGHAIGVTGTPTIIINGRRFREPPRTLPAYIQELLDQ